MRAVIAILLLVLALLQYRLWVGDGGFAENWRLGRRIEAQQAENEVFRQRNRRLEAEVRDLKEGLEAIEERARRDLGMVKRDETFYLIVEE
jgi:cell division protein FtsB